MAHCEIILDSNIVDVSFSQTGTRIAVLTKESFSIFAWSLKSRPVPAPLLESSYPLPEEPESRPRQIAFLKENEVYILNHKSPYQAQIERTALETRATRVVYQASGPEQLQSIFASLGHDKLWFCHTTQPNTPVSYSTIEVSPDDSVDVHAWNESPTSDTFWAKAIHIPGDEVRTIPYHDIEWY